MSASTPTRTAPEGRSLQPPAVGRRSPALLARADRGYVRFLVQAVPDDCTDEHEQDDAVRR
ncbi:hypothetical protein [Streptomyces lancefieldiae]|uniref:Uncharacterized protein n=1 Tax=Streptomyces lancefieldiae TaxID=3075520 RepID=A0ABU3B3Y9_9ACTN|nr:hypothetical protein [Streptomyces sp. DSM 40712]MDT0616547.1 hypothetical protein [Streptomyces sp. DSM 40712]